MEIFLCILCCLFVLLLPSFLCFYLLPSVFKRGDMNIFMQSIMERLRPLVGSKGWDYCILWKLSEDQRFIEWMNCCCGGIDQNNSENNNNGSCGDEELLFPLSPVIPCRDTMFQHQRTNSCDLLSQLPISMPLDSGIYAQALITNQPSWLNSSCATSSHFLEEFNGTRVLIPLPGGLVELFVSKQISEDQNMIDFITSQCNIPLDHHHHHQQDLLINPIITCNNNNIDNTTTNPNFIVNINSPINNEIQSRPFIITDTNLSQNTAFDSLNLTYGPRGGGDRFFEEQMDVGPAMHGGGETMQMEYVEGGDKMEQLQGVVEIKDAEINNKGVGGEGRANSMSDCSDQIDEEEEGSKPRRKSGGKGPQCKNLVAERRRRKKLNERLYTLRSLVPKISKLDRASILGDAIEYVKDLQRQAKELQDELEEHSENNDESVKNNGLINGKRLNNVSSEIFLNHDDAKLIGTKLDHENGFHFETSAINGSTSKQYQASDNANDKAPQMEPQVEVAQIDGNEFFVKVFCEHKPGRFVRLMEALNSLSLEVTNANVTTFRNLVSNVLKVEKKDSKMLVQADHLRDFLLELTRNPSRGLSDLSKVSENGNNINNIDYQHHHHHHQPNY